MTSSLDRELTPRGYLLWGLLFTSFVAVAIWVMVTSDDEGWSVWVTLVANGIWAAVLLRSYVAQRRRRSAASSTGDDQTAAGPEVTDTSTR